MSKTDDEENEWERVREKLYLLVFPSKIELF